MSRNIRRSKKLVSVSIRMYSAVRGTSMSKGKLEVKDTAKVVVEIDVNVPLINGANAGEREVDAGSNVVGGLVYRKYKENERLTKEFSRDEVLFGLNVQYMKAELVELINQYGSEGDSEIKSIRRRRKEAVSRERKKETALVSERSPSELSMRKSAKANRKKQAKLVELKKVYGGKKGGVGKNDGKNGGRIVVQESSIRRELRIREQEILNVVFTKEEERRGLKVAYMKEKLAELTKQYGYKVDLSIQKIRKGRKKALTEERKKLKAGLIGRTREESVSRKKLKKSMCIKESKNMVDEN